MSKGMFITFEGIDKAGKSTQMALFCEYLKKNGIEYIKTREPGGCPVSEKIRDILLDSENEIDHYSEALLYAASRSAHVRQVIKPALENGLYVICDRYLDSSIAYQGYGRNLGEDYIRAINKAAVDGIYPDLTFLLVIDRDSAYGRTFDVRDRMESADSAFYTRTQEGYRQLANKGNGRIITIDASKSISDVHNEIIEAYLQNRTK